MEFNKEILKGYITSIILSVLYTKDMYGYEISKQILKVSKEKFKIKEVTLYAALKRLEKNELLEGYWNDKNGTGGGRRRYYSITEKGKKYFLESLDEWEVLQNTLDYFFRRHLYE